MSPDDLGSRIDRLCDRLTADGDLLDPAWRAAFHAVPRHLFVPERAWAAPNGPDQGFLIDRAIDPGTWWDTVYSDAAIITQRADGTADVAEFGEPSSSCSAPGTVAEFLSHLSPEDHNRVLEVGTGTGWTAALLSYRVGAGNVASIDIDPTVSEIAAKNLSGAGHAPRLFVGDGTLGLPEAAPFDRVHVAAGVTDIPYTWVEQTRPGGVIVLPFAPGWGFGWLARLHVLGDGTAVGAFPGFAGYMPLRGQRVPWRSLSDLPAEGLAESVTRLDPRRLRTDAVADLFLAAAVPGVRTHLSYGEADACTLWLVESGDDGAWASVDHVPGQEEFLVRQQGARRLWDEAEQAYLRWLGMGRPAYDRLGLTVSPEGRQIWIDRPEHLVTPATSGG
ncbi:methyltransferase domain-containing protein [Actinoallomurus oryzae]|uniref:Protein-L-isoaspartate O-methyltransferase n=1 Tax=Actinoallomurus oryzae TaxID=502180 RepID=A0ABP8PGE1_9ACTN